MKQSGDKASRIAGKWLAECRGIKRGLVHIWVTELKTLCASVLSQDETKGKRKPKGRRR